MPEQTALDFFAAIFGTLKDVSTDPVKSAQEWLIIILALIALLYCYQYRRRVCEALTGDPWLHCNPLDCIWFTFFRCCGLCYGDCTRYCTACSCCPRRWRRKNIVQELGKRLGVYTYPVELKNIVVGDLPFDKSHGDFYLQVEVGTNPAMVSSLQEDQMPKVVHFPEVLTIRVRNNLLEQRIRIVVKELNVVGHVEICDLYLTPLSVLDWMNDADPMKRFQMTPRDRNSLERETPPWICIEFSEQTEVRDIEALADWSTNSVQVRTWVPQSTFNEKYLPKSAMPTDQHILKTHSQLDDKASEEATPFLGLWGSHYNVENRNVYNQDMATFKKAYPLMDEGGNPINVEVEEDDLRSLESTRWCLACMYHCVIWIVVIILIAFCCGRAYLYSCYRQYKLLTIAGLNNTAFPVSFAVMNKLQKDCDARLEGTGAPYDGSDYCRPSQEQIYRHCEHGTQQPRAFQKFAHDWFGITDFEGLYCNGPEHICEIRDHIVVRYNCDNVVVILSLVMVVGVCCLRWGFNTCLQKKRTYLQRRRAQYNREFQKDVESLHQNTAKGISAGDVIKGAQAFGGASLLGGLARGH
mmetsp:Transcript_112249/g.198887  ORF Transcript_112249/g.198887 Transcript_112249/m.198887 type:complete len:581 (-) Transcript_112249:139-1881(-)